MKQTQQPEAPVKRLASLDSLRGFDMFWIIGGENVVHGIANASGLPFLNFF